MRSVHRDCVRRMWGLALISCAFTGLSAGGAQFEATETKRSPRKNFALGQLLDQGDGPLAGATIRPTGLSTGPSTTWGGTCPPGLPDHVRSDTNGDFTLSYAKPFVRVQVHIEAPGVGSGDLWLDAGVLTVIHFGPFEIPRPPSMLGPRGPRIPGAGPGFPAATSNGPPFRPELRPFGPGPPPGWTNGPAGPGAMSRTGSSDNGQAIVRLCPWPPGQTNPMVARAAKRVRLTGRVQTRTGEPVPDGLQVRVRSGQESESAEPDSEGQFVFNGVPEGEVAVWVDRERRYRLTPSTGGRSAPTGGCPRATAIAGCSGTAPNWLGCWRRTRTTCCW